MLSFFTPIWLSGLVLLPAIRWLHRGGRHLRAVPVTRLALWRGSAASSPAAGERRPPDPAWRRRALLTAMLLFALAEPQFPQERIRMTLWIDDSLSMLTREEQGSRLAMGMAQVRSLLAAHEPAEVEVRTLGEPWRNLGALNDTTTTTVLASAGRREPNAPPAALLRRDSLHWLVTDGADAALSRWPGDQRPDRIIQVAGVTRNLGLERLSARRNRSDPERIDLLLKVTNGGSAVETREVVFFTDKGEMARSTHRLDAGTSGFVVASIPVSARVRAALQPGDALAEDDEIALDLAALGRRRVATDSTCPKALAAAVGAHPALALAPESATDVQVVLHCGTSGAASDVATIRVRADHTPMRLRGPVRWSSAVAESRRIRLDPDRLQVAGRLQPGPADTVLLAVGDEPVIVSRAGMPARLETALDFESFATAGGPEIPLLMNLMFERLLGGRLLDEIAITDRGPGSANVVPRDGAGAGADPPVPSDSRVLGDGTRPVLMVALLTLLWEIFALGRQWFRLGGYAARAPE